MKNLSGRHPAARDHGFGGSDALVTIAPRSRSFTAERTERLVDAVLNDGGEVVQSYSSKISNIQSDLFVRSFVRSFDLWWRNWGYCTRSCAVSYWLRETMQG